MAWSIVRNSLHPPMQMQVSRVDEDGNVASPVFVPGDVAVLRVRKPDGTRTDLALTIEDPATGIVQRTWVAGDTAVTGMHRGIVVINPGVGVQDETFPSDGTYLAWTVERGL